MSDPASDAFVDATPFLATPDDETAAKPAGASTTPTLDAIRTSDPELYKLITGKPESWLLDAYAPNSGQVGEVLPGPGSSGTRPSYGEGILWVTKGTLYGVRGGRRMYGDPLPDGSSYKEGRFVRVFDSQAEAEAYARWLSQNVPELRRESAIPSEYATNARGDITRIGVLEIAPGTALLTGVSAPQLEHDPLTKQFVSGYPGGARQDILPVGSKARVIREFPVVGADLPRSAPGTASGGSASAAASSAPSADGAAPASTVPADGPGNAPADPTVLSVPLDEPIPLADHQVAPVEDVSVPSPSILSGLGATALSTGLGLLNSWIAKRNAASDFTALLRGEWPRVVADIQRRGSEIQALTRQHPAQPLYANVTVDAKWTIYDDGPVLRTQTLSGVIYRSVEISSTPVQTEGPMIGDPDTFWFLRGIGRSQTLTFPVTIYTPRDATRP